MILLKKCFKVLIEILMVYFMVTIIQKTQFVYKLIYVSLELGILLNTSV